MSTPLLVTCEWLNEQISSGCKDADLVILDVSWSSTKNCYEEFQKQHIPGAQYLNVLDAEHTDIYPRNIPSVESFTDKAQKAGINASSRIVVYSNSDKAGYFLSGRGWWTLKYFGHKNVSILDGGLQRWLQLGFPTSEETTEPQKGNCVASIDSTIRTAFEDVRDNVDTERFQLIDTRPNSAYEEKNIPRAKNIEMGVLVDTENGTLKNKDELNNIFSAAGIDLSRPVVAHCNSGMSSCTVAFVAQYLGAKDASVFHVVEIDSDQATCDTESKTLSSVIDSLEVWKNDQVRTYIGMYRVKAMTNESNKKLKTVKRYADRRTVMDKYENRLKSRLKESNALLCSNTLWQSYQKATSDVKDQTYSVAFGKKAREQQVDNTEIFNIDTMWDGCLIASDWNKNIYKINQNMNLVEKIPVKFNVRFVCMMENNYICISFQRQHEIHIAAINGGTLETKRVINIGKQCRGVCFKTGKLYVACGEEQDAGLRVYSKEGEFIKEYDKDSNGQNLFSAPYALTTSSDGSTLFVADEQKGAIALTADGTGLWTYSDICVVSGIWNIVLGDKGDIYVCGFNSNNIVKISGDGKLVAEVLKCIKNPRDICYDDENERFIVLYDANRISVYDMIKTQKMY